MDRFRIFELTRLTLMVILALFFGLVLLGLGISIMDGSRPSIAGPTNSSHPVIGWLTILFALATLANPFIYMKQHDKQLYRFIFYGAMVWLAIVFLVSLY